MTPMKKIVEKEGGKKEMIMVEVKNGSASQATARLWRSRLRRRRKRWRHPSFQMRLGRRQNQVSLDRCPVKVTQKEKESTDSSDSVSDNESSTTQ
jgi:hypothetical protein